MRQASRGQYATRHRRRWLAPLAPLLLAGAALAARADAESRFSCTFDNESALPVKVVVYEDRSSKPREKELQPGERHDFQFEVGDCSRVATWQFSLFEGELHTHIAEGAFELTSGAGAAGKRCEPAGFDFASCKDDRGDGFGIACRSSDDASGRVRITDSKRRSQLDAGDADVAP